MTDRIKAYRQNNKVCHLIKRLITRENVVQKTAWIIEHLENNLLKEMD